MADITCKGCGSDRVYKSENNYYCAPCLGLMRVRTAFSNQNFEAIKIPMSAGDAERDKWWHSYMIASKQLAMADVELGIKDYEAEERV